MNLQQAKALFFAQYLGQELCIVRKPDNLEYSQTPFDENKGGLFLSGVLNNQIIVRRIAEDVRDRFNQTALLLRTVNQLTDEEIIKISLAIGLANPKIDRTSIRIRIIDDSYIIYFYSSGLIQTYKNERYYINGEIDIINQIYLRFGIIKSFTYIDETGKPVTLSVEQIIELGWAKIKTI